MSLMRTVLRLSAVQALRQRTWAVDRVFDSDNTPLSQAVITKDEKLPYIVVYTDTDNRTGPFMGREVYNANRETSLVLEIAVASAVEGDGETAVIRTPPTDQGMELAIDFTEAQAIRALFGDPQSEWCELIHDIVSRIVRMPSVRAGDSSKGIKFAARQTVIVCDIIADPPAGVTYESLSVYDDDGALVRPHPIIRFITMARAAGGEFAEAANLIELMINTQADYPQWQKDQAWLGLTREAMRAGGTAPLPDPAVAPFTVPDSITDDEGDTPGPVEEITLVEAGEEPPFNEDFPTPRE